MRLEGQVAMEIVVVMFQFQAYHSELLLEEFPCSKAQFGVALMMQSSSCSRHVAIAILP